MPKEKQKVAKLVTLSVTVRVIVDEDATDLEILEVAHSLCMNALQNDGVFDHFESIIDDTECPLGLLPE